MAPKKRTTTSYGARAVQTEGLKEFRTKLGRFDKELNKEVTRMMKEAGQIAAEDARANAPVASGRLRRSINVRVTRQTAVIKAGGVRAFYARWQEYGTKFFKGRYFMHNAVRRNRSRIQNHIVRGFRQVLRKHMR